MGNHEPQLIEICGIWNSSDLRIKVEKRIEALLQLRLDLLARALQHVHRHMRLVPVRQLERSVVNLRHFALRQQPHSIHKSQIRHVRHLYIGL